MSDSIPMLDLMFFLTETQDNPRHVGAVQIFRLPKRGGANTVAEIVDAYRHVRPFPPFNRVPVFQKTGMPQWREVDSIDHRHHVLHLALPAPGSDEQLHQLVAELHAPMLERHRPGWKVYVIEGLSDGRFAIYHKVHHALVDGESGMEILIRSLATSAADRRIRATVSVRRKHRPRPAPHDLRERLEREANVLARRTLSIGRGSAHLFEATLEGLRGFSRTKARAFTAPHTPMNDPIYNARSITHARFPLPEMQRIARRHGAKLNDVALCIVDAGLNRYLRALGRQPDHPLVALCPVSLHDAGAKEATTRVSAIWPALGKAQQPVAQRLATIVASTQRAKEEMRALGKDAAYAYAVLAFAMTETLVIAQPKAFGMLPANVLVSNVRGPERTLYLNGAKLEALFPVSTLIVGVGLNITFMSYGREVIMGFTANGAALPEIESLAAHTREAFAQLREA
jgi:diacylglycerol O-acyltransferase / wax synthase